MNFIACAVCLNLDNSARVPAITVIDGYACCGVHAQALAAPFTDFAQLIARLKTTNPTETAT